jgi:hypothetical protein
MNALFWLLALSSLANALWMLAAPAHWYAVLPAAVPDFGPFNAHFVRDIGCAYATIGVALVLAATRPAWRAPLAGVAALFFGAHALLHVYDTARGAVELHHLALDAIPVYLPALALAVVARRLSRLPEEPMQ